jgi:GDP-4-dehydro-6-deoxy-D-mannose reductase
VEVAAIGHKGSAARGSVIKFFEVCGVPVQEEIERILRNYKPDIVYHLAGSASADDIETLYHVNLFYCARLLAACRTSLAGGRIVIVGSAAEYGAAKRVGRLILETDPAVPTTAYGHSKLSQTRHALSQKDLCIVVVRAFNPIGEGMPPNLALGAFVRRMAALGPGGGTVRTGPLTAVRDICDARDLAYALAAMADQPLPASNVYNLCTGVPTRMRDLTNELEMLAAAPIAFHEEGGDGGLSWSVGNPSLLARHGITIPPPDLRALLRRVLEAFPGVPSPNSAASAWSPRLLLRPAAELQALN